MNADPPTVLQYVGPVAAAVAAVVSVMALMVARRARRDSARASTETSKLANETNDLVVASNRKVERASQTASSALEAAVRSTALAQEALGLLERAEARATTVVHLLFCESKTGFVLVHARATGSTPVTVEGLEVLGGPPSEPPIMLTGVPPRPETINPAVRDPENPDGWHPVGVLDYEKVLGLEKRFPVEDLRIHLQGQPPQDAPGDGKKLTWAAAKSIPLG